jgi:acetyl esterase/lipase
MRPAKVDDCRLVEVLSIAEQRLRPSLDADAQSVPAAMAVRDSVRMTPSARPGCPDLAAASISSAIGHPAATGGPASSMALPAAAVLMSPTVDLTSSGASMTERADQDPISTPAMLRQFASDYLAGADPKTPLASPLFAQLAGLPPLLVQVGTADLLLSDSERLAAAAAAAGVDVTLEIGEGLPHVYQLMLGTPEAAEAAGRIGKFLRARVR